MIELRCPNKLHGKVFDHLVEVACNSARCGKRPGVVVLHRYDLLTGELVDTKRYKSPRQPQEDVCP